MAGSESHQSGFAKNTRGTLAALVIVYMETSKKQPFRCVSTFAAFEQLVICSLPGLLQTHLRLEDRATLSFSPQEHNFGRGETAGIAEAANTVLK